MDDDAIRALVTRLARPHRSGGDVIERAAIFADAADFAEVMAWLSARGAVAESVVVTPHGGLHNLGRESSDGAAPTPRRFVLPPGALSS